MIYIAITLAAAVKTADKLINRDFYVEKEKKERIRRNNLSDRERRRETMNSVYLHMR